MNANTVAVEPIKTQRTLFDLDSMEEVTVQKIVPFTNVTSTAQALEMLGNDANKFLAVINRGLRAEIGNNAVKDPSIPWQVENEETGDLTNFTGTLVDAKNVNTLVLNLAKQVFGYGDKNTPIEQRRKAKEDAKNFIKSSPVIREGFRKSALSAEPEAAE